MGECFLQVFFVLIVNFSFLTIYFTCRHKNGFPVPIPHKLRPDIPDTEIQKFLARDYISQYATDKEKLEAAVRYALSYREGFEQLQVSASEAHMDAISLTELAGEVQANASTMAKDAGCSLRLIGGVCQSIKVCLTFWFA